MTPSRHGGSVEVPVEAVLSEDPDLHLVWASMEGWYTAHPCDTSHSQRALQSHGHAVPYNP